MTDSRFTPTADDVGALLQMVGVDEVGDVETLLMLLFARPIWVGEAWDDEGLAPLHSKSSCAATKLASSPIVSSQ